MRRLKYLFIFLQRKLASSFAIEFDAIWQCLGLLDRPVSWSSQATRRHKVYFCNRIFPAFQENLIRIARKVSCFLGSRRTRTYSQEFIIFLPTSGILGRYEWFVASGGMFLFAVFSNSCHLAVYASFMVLISRSDGGRFAFWKFDRFKEIDSNDWMKSAGRMIERVNAEIAATNPTQHSKA